MLVTRIGPVDEWQGAFAYLRLGPLDVLGAIVGSDDRYTLEWIAQQELPDEPLECTFELARVGRRCGYSLSPLPRDLIPLVAAYALRAAIYEPLQPVSVPLEILREFGYAAGDFLRSAPWEHWTRDQELRVRANDWDAVLTVSMYGGNATVNLAEPHAVGELPRYQLGVSFRPKVPPFARLWLQQAFGLLSVPQPARLSGVKLESAGTYDVLTLTATLRALSGLSRQTPRASATEQSLGLKVRVDIEAPLPQAGYAVRGFFATFAMRDPRDAAGETAVKQGNDTSFCFGADAPSDLARAIWICVTIPSLFSNEEFAETEGPEAA